MTTLQQIARAIQRNGPAVFLSHEFAENIRKSDAPQDLKDLWAQALGALAGVDAYLTEAGAYEGLDEPDRSGRIALDTAAQETATGFRVGA